MTPTRPLVRAAVRLLSGFVVALLAAPPLAAQSQLASQTLGRGYWHMFLAYAVAWALVLGWIWSIARRLGRVESKLDEG